MSFNIALSGLGAARSDLDVTGNNIANASTAGFKKSRAEFADIFASNFSRVSDTAVGGGVRVASVSQQFEQGNVRNTGNALDIALVGEGFLVVESGDGEASYTRDGAFGIDREGFVVNNFNQRLQVYPPGTIEGSFNTGTLSDLQLTTTVGEPSATSSVEASLNFAAEPEQVNQAFLDGDAIDPTDDGTFDFTTSLTVFDSLGSPHTATIYARRKTIADVTDATGAPSGTPVESNDWELALYIDGRSYSDFQDAGANDGDPSTPPDSPFATINLSFDRNGRVISPADADVTVGTPDPSEVNFFFGPGDLGTAPDSATLTPLELGNGAADLSFLLDFTGTTMLGTRFSVNDLLQDGFTTGELAGIDISDDGIVQARFTNGRTDPLGKIALANFNNPQGLTQAGDNQWLESFESGDVLLGEANASGFGSIQAGSLEESNVDLTEELVNLITAQRNFDANSQVIRTENEVTQTAVNLGR